MHYHAPTAGSRHKGPLVIAFALTAAFMVVEFAVGWWTGSLALLSDAAHMGTDVAGLGMALAAITLAARPRTPQRTFGLYRLEVLAALANGILLFAVAGFVLVESVRRFGDPPEVPGAPLLVTAVAGLVVNLICMRLLAEGQGESINVRGAYLEVMADMVGSIGVIVAAVVMLTTGWHLADPIMGVAIGVFILPRTWKLVRRALAILMESAPDHLDVQAIERDIRAVDGVHDVHDLHIWTITSGMDAASGHVVVDADVDASLVLTGIREALHEHGIDHMTVQCEPQGYAGAERGTC